MLRANCRGFFDSQGSGLTNQKSLPSSSRNDANPNPTQIGFTLQNSQPPISSQFHSFKPLNPSLHYHIASSSSSESCIRPKNFVIGSIGFGYKVK
jgi:hypothetical protein